MRQSCISAIRTSPSATLKSEHLSRCEIRNAGLLDFTMIAFLFRYHKKRTSPPFVAFWTTSVYFCDLCFLGKNKQTNNFEIDLKFFPRRKERAKPQSTRK